MPPTTTQYPHLPLIHEEPNPERRKRPYFGSAGFEGEGRRAFGATLAMQVNNLEAQSKQRPRPVVGIQPHLVFRVPVSPKASKKVMIERLQDVNIDVVSIEPNNVIVAFQDDNSLDKFQQAIAEYQEPRIDNKTGLPCKGTKWDIFEQIEVEQMSLFSNEDRIGSQLASSIGAKGEGIDNLHIYTLDVELWHRGNHEKASENLEELRILVERSSNQGSLLERVWDTFIGSNICIARVSVTGAKLRLLLEMDAVFVINLPPIAEFDEIQTFRSTKEDFPPVAAPPENGPRVCVIDSGIAANHPLLKAHVGHEESVLTATSTPADMCGHGTKVGGLAVFGNIRGCYSDGVFSSPITLFSARVLNDKNEFDDRELFATQIRKAVETFMRPPHNCRVFNLSLGTSTPAETQGGKRQAQWAAVLDELARQHKVLLVVAAGNNTSVFTQTDTQKAEYIKNNYPSYLFEADAALNDPATAAIAVTVGALAEYDQVTPGINTMSNDIRLPVVQANQPSPLSRVGPGVQKSIKPDFVHYGGNIVFEGFGNTRRIPRSANPGTGVMSLSHEPTKGLFAFDVGTSFAAPRVARIAALLWNRLKEDRQNEPDPNLVRAILATAARVPAAARNAIEPSQGEQGIRNLCGYGLIDENLALLSLENRVTLCTQDNIQMDTFKIYEVPIPSEFLKSKGDKAITVALAFDPPARRTRADSYLGVTMQACLIRGKTPQEITEAYRAKLESDSDNLPGAFELPFRCDMQPASSLLSSSTLQRSIWRFRRSSETYGDSYYLVVWAMRKWAPPEITHQDFAVAVTLEAPEDCKLYNLVKLRVEQRIEQRTRNRERVRS